jgi:hypothetical protein
MKKKRATKKRQKPDTAIVVREVQQQLDSSAIPRIAETVKNLERIRRFIQLSLNRDLRRELERVKLQLRPPLTDAERTKLEIDYGTTPGIDKPYLKQPGAEKFLFWLNLRPKYTTTATELPGGHLEVVSHVTIIHKKTKEEVFEGPDCSCTTMESNYRFRWVARKDDNDQYEFPTEEEKIRLKMQGLGRFRKIDEWIHGRKTGKKILVWYDRTENPNIADTRNTVRQISPKRALVKSVRGLGALSEIFSTDPGEWSLMGDDDEDLDPLTEQDYTPSGATIVGADGKTPSGRIVDPGPQKEEIAANKIAEMKNPMQTPAPTHGYTSVREANPFGKNTPKIKEVTIVDLGEGDISATGGLEDDRELAQFLTRIEALSQKDRHQRLWFKIGSGHVAEFRQIIHSKNIPTIG